MLGCKLFNGPAEILACLQYAALATKITAARLEPPPRGGKVATPAAATGKLCALELSGGDTERGVFCKDGSSAQLRRELMEKEEEVEELTTRVWLWCDDRLKVFSSVIAG